MDRLMGALDQWLWRHEYWLPPGITWEDMQGQEGAWYPRPRDLLVSLPMALGFIALRCVFERFVALPLGRRLGVCSRTWVPVRPVPPLEAFYTQQNHQPSQNEILRLTKQCDLTQRQVLTWFRRRRNLDRPNYTRKFCEACWRFAFYMLAFSAGLAVMIDAPWFWDQRECWNGYPLQTISEAHYWYYMTELAFYWSLLLCVSVDIKRKDFKEQIVHHIATISLLGFSYCSNYVRVGTLVMLVHDTSDFLLESAKMFNYAKWRKTCDSLFFIFTLVFLVTRLLVFPSKVIYTTLVLSMEVFTPFFGYYFFNALLLVLQALHVFWAWLILRMVYKFMFKGMIERDERSDVESGDDDDGNDEEEEEEEWGREKRKDSLSESLDVFTQLTSQRSSPSNRMPNSR
ncbi:ceramide synthase 2-like [Conger conger]|uniref:ceramide synthase 2-like n=1 Tax=Conger conger TaxID=82655 RepID=UPI002A59F583|nr:ceramide synthase 2-like [Conger conger]